MPAVFRYGHQIITQLDLILLYKSVVVLLLIFHKICFAYLMMSCNYRIIFHAIKLSSLLFSQAGKTSVCIQQRKVQDLCRKQQALKPHG